MNQTLEDMAINELGEGGIIQKRFSDRGDSPDCIKAFKSYFCWMNFPRCDQEDKSLVMCRSACENLHIACDVSVSTLIFVIHQRLLILTIGLRSMNKICGVVVNLSTSTVTEVRSR
jgi:hypothetical protein